MATIQDVAKRAGVAPITVSRFINNSGYCSMETRARVEAAIAELGYVPNRLASGLRSKRTNTLALVLTDITNPFFTTIARGVEDTASDAGYAVIFCNTDESISEEKKYLRMLLEQRVDGIILVPALSTHDSVDFIEEHETPIVVLDRRIPGVKADVVRCDSEGGAYELTRLLISLGHRHIAVLSGPRGTSTAEDRVAGSQRAIVEANLERSTQKEYYGSFTQQSGYELTRQALEDSPTPTALFATNNFIAIGALKALQDLGVHVPEDVALVGFDDLPPALITFPFLTVAAQPAYEMGRLATEVLLKRISNEMPEEYQEFILPTEIIERGSSGLNRS
jgi:LacI family transcriptional regulator